ncbi:MAG: DUF4097 family beta strand repeat-containing protein [Bacilli bacterium]|nr:DUF4097 family beta strand repeat-containing protein [Bacilli bacterium]
MKDINKIIKYIAIVFACFLVVSIFAGIIKLILAFALVTTSDDKEYDYTTVDKMDIKKSVDTLVVDIAATDLNIKTGDKLKVDTNNQYIKIATKNNKLIVKEEKHKFYKNDKKDINIYIPEDYILNRVDIDTGAGKIKIDKLITNRLDLDLGAGTALLSNIEVLNDSDIDTGAGKVTITDSVFNNLDFDAGVGSVTINGDILGKSSIDAGVGALNINLINNTNNYTIKCSKGIGSFKINGNSIKDGETYGSGDNIITISGGVGSIKVNTQDLEEKDNTFTKKYIVISKVDSNKKNKYYVTLKEFDGDEVDTVLIEDKYNDLEVDFIYEFNFKGTNSNKIEEVFKNELINFNKTDSD